MENCERYICIYLGGNAYGLSAKNGRVKKSFAMLNEENATDPLKRQLLLPECCLVCSLGSRLKTGHPWFQ